MCSGDGNAIPGGNETKHVSIEGYNGYPRYEITLYSDGTAEAFVTSASGNEFHDNCDWEVLNHSYHGDGGKFICVHVCLYYNGVNHSEGVALKIGSNKVYSYINVRGVGSVGNEMNAKYTIK